MSVERLAVEASAAQVARVRAVVARTQQVWSTLDVGGLEQQWAAAVPAVAQTLTVAQLASAAAAAQYVVGQAAEQGVPETVGRVVPRAWAGTAANGASLAAVLSPAPAAVRAAQAAGLSSQESMLRGLVRVVRLVAEETRSAWYGPLQAQQTATPGLSGYVRMLNGASCARCVVLAGRWYRWSSGFARHEGCDCVSLPAAEARGVEDLRTDPRGYFDRLSEAEQDRTFGRAGAQAIRDGADMSQVVNVSVRRGGRGPSGLFEHDLGDGRRLQATYEATTVREGRAGRRLAQASAQGRGRALEAFERADTARLTPRSIYEVADGDRDKAVELLRQYGYIDSTPIRRSARAATRDLSGADAGDAGRASGATSRGVSASRGSGSGSEGGDGRGRPPAPQPLPEPDDPLDLPGDDLRVAQPPHYNALPVLAPTYDAVSSLAIVEDWSEPLEKAVADWTRAALPAGTRLWRTRKPGPADALFELPFPDGVLRLRDGWVTVEFKNGMRGKRGSWLAHLNKSQRQSERVVMLLPDGLTRQDMESLLVEFLSGAQGRQERIVLVSGRLALRWSRQD